MLKWALQHNATRYTMQTSLIWCRNNCYLKTSWKLAVTAATAVLLLLLPAVTAVLLLLLPAVTAVLLLLLPAATAVLHFHKYESEVNSNSNNNSITDKTDWLPVRLPACLLAWFVALHEVAHCSVGQYLIVSFSTDPVLQTNPIWWSKYDCIRGLEMGVSGLRSTTFVIMYQNVRLGL